MENEELLYEEEEVCCCQVRAKLGFVLVVCGAIRRRRYGLNSSIQTLLMLSRVVATFSPTGKRMQQWTLRLSWTLPIRHKSFDREGDTTSA